MAVRLGVCDTEALLVCAASVVDGRSCSGFASLIVLLLSEQPCLLWASMRQQGNSQGPSIN